MGLSLVQYRSLLGLPGGSDSAYFSVIKSAAANSPMKLFKGEGNEPDTLGSKAVLVMDSNKFPFFPAEVTPLVAYVLEHVHNLCGLIAGLPPIPQRLHGPTIWCSLQQAAAKRAGGKAHQPHRLSRSCADHLRQYAESHLMLRRLRSRCRCLRLDANR